MISNNDKREYKMSDADLCMFVSILTGFLTRDLSDYTKFGLDAAKITAFEAMGNAFEVFPTDNVLSGDVLVATDEKNVLREQVLTSITELLYRVEAKWSVNSVQYKRLAIKNPSKLSDEGLLSAARMLHLQISDDLIDLTSLGLTQDILDDFEDLVQEFELAKKAQADAIALRDEKTRERIMKGNELYELVVTYCGFGKILYEKTNYAKYNDYIIYDTTSPGTLTAPTGLSFYFPSTTFSWEPVDNASSYRLMASVNNTDWFEVFAGMSTECVYIPVQPGNMFYKVQARNDGGLGPFSDILTQGYYPGTVLPAPENLVLQLAPGSPNTIQLTFDEVASASSYGISRNISDILAPAGPFAFVTNVNEPIYIENIIPGHRFYFNVTASNSHQWSGVSANVFLDVPE